MCEGDEHDWNKHKSCLMAIQCTQVNNLLMLFHGHSNVSINQRSHSLVVSSDISIGTLIINQYNTMTFVCVYVNVVHYSTVTTVGDERCTMCWFSDISFTQLLIGI